MAPASARRYELRVERHLGSGSAALFPELDLRHEPDGSTVLTGVLADQAALHGVLARVRDLGLVLIGVAELPHDAGPG